MQGETGALPFMTPPTLMPTVNRLVIGHAGPPHGDDRCIASQPGPNDGGPTVVRRSPSIDAAIIAELGFNRWADVVHIFAPWYQIDDGAGVIGWVHRSELALSGPCLDWDDGPVP